LVQGSQVFQADQVQGLSEGTKMRMAIHQAGNNQPARQVQDFGLAGTKRFYFLIGSKERYLSVFDSHCLGPGCFRITGEYPGGQNGNIHHIFPYGALSHQHLAFSKSFALIVYLNTDRCLLKVLSEILSFL
jgi:hypothetical protein